MLDAGAVTSQGDLSQASAKARASFGLTGTGVRIGVLSFIGHYIETNIRRPPAKLFDSFSGFSISGGYFLIPLCVGHKH
jgi:hypothetical protein